MFKYAIYDENNELMRKCNIFKQAQYICYIRPGWYIKKIKFSMPTFEDAPF
jgi:hypothetical protein